MTQLRQEGWIHHLARHAVACFLTRGDLWISWEEGMKVHFCFLVFSVLADLEKRLQNLSLAVGAGTQSSASVPSLARNLTVSRWSLSPALLGAAVRGRSHPQGLMILDDEDVGDLLSLQQAPRPDLWALGCSVTASCSSFLLANCLAGEQSLPGVPCEEGGPDQPNLTLCLPAYLFFATSPFQGCFSLSLPVPEVQVFEELLLDADYSINAGNWMWLSASAFFHQYTRIFCPVRFGKRTDPEGQYIR